MKTIRSIIILLLASMPAIASEGSNPDTSPWLKPRSMDNFKSLLQRSPFSLPTVEETTPPPDRFFLTGVASINEKPVVFVFDKNTHNRLMLKQLENLETQSKDHLLEIFPSADLKNVRASVQIEGQRSEIHFEESSFAMPTIQPIPTQHSAPGLQAPPQQPPAPQQQANAQPPIVQSGNDSDSKPPRRVIRRRIISGQAQSSSPAPGQ